ncbi:MAG: VWA domain-containing protein [Aeromonadaceae bacterium]
MADWTLLRPWCLLLLLLPLLLFFLNLRRQRRGQSFIRPELLDYLNPGQAQLTQGTQFWLLAVKAVAWLLAVLALAGPAQQKQSDLFQQDETWIWMLDVSHSMLADDAPPSRLSRARYQLLQLLELAQGRHIGLIAFAGDAYVISPPTDDMDTLRFLLRELTPDVMPTPGSNPLAAVKLGHQILEQSGANHGRLLLITDDIKPEQSKAIQALGKSNPWPMDVFAVGTEQGAPIKLPSGNLLRDRLGNIVIAKSDRAELSRLASNGSGRLFTLQPGDNAEQLAGLLLHPSSTGQASGLQQLQLSDLGYWLLFPLLLLAAGFRRGLLVIPLLLTLAQSHPVVAEEGQTLYQKGEYLAAAALLTDPVWRGNALFRARHFAEAAEAYRQSDTAEGWYNLGNALANQQRLDDAIAAYDEALNIAPDLEDARYNRDLIKQWLSDYRSADHNPSQQEQTDDQTKPMPLLKQVAEQPGNLMKNRLRLQSQKRITRGTAQPW